ncbi:MAG: glycine--tRNA ligase subunit beta [Burkholderiales bacterium]|nr:glycine--tRNA ligase subunit beta [Burkholderiales bacterium]
MNQTLLIELLTEELPPKALAKLGDAFATGIANGLRSRDFLEGDAAVTSYATPRRLAVSITKARGTSPDKPMREKILPVSVGLDANGKATPALLKKWAALGFNGEPPVAEFEKVTEGKNENLYYSYVASGSKLIAGLTAAVEETVAKLPIPKVMNYQRPDGTTVAFVRPAHKLIALHGKDVVPISLLGLEASRTTLGHRFLSSGEISIPDAESYESVLEAQGKVIANVGERKEKIRAALLSKAGKDHALMPEALLDEVNALVEWPIVYECHFEEEFLAVPQECLILTMQTNQKYFALTDANGKLRSRFLIVSNIETPDPQHIIGGNERVVRPRLSDAKFFFEQDKKKKLADRLPNLANVVYHNKLGTQAERTERVKKLAAKIAQGTGGDVALAERAALLAKTDLLTDMVGEFPELQGIMGTYYAKHDGEPTEVAQAICEHYQPRFAGDALPMTQTGTVVALADKLETLAGLFGIGQQPTGDKDPFALRRHALGVLRLLMEKNLGLNLSTLINAAYNVFPPKMLGQSQTDLSIFFVDRLRGLLRDQDYTANEVEAVVSINPDAIDLVPQQIAAVRAFAALPEAEALAAANKRITNILKKAENAGDTVQQGLLKESAEQGLYEAMSSLKPQVDTAYAKGDFTATLKLLAKLRTSVDAFFDGVMVMAEDVQLRNNRIALLSQLHGMMNRVADISKLAA